MALNRSPDLKVRAIFLELFVHNGQAPGQVSYAVESRLLLLLDVFLASKDLLFRIYFLFQELLWLPALC